MWFISYRHSARRDEGGVKFVRGEAEAVAERQMLESLGYIIERIGQTSRARIEALLDGTLTDRNKDALN